MVLIPEFLEDFIIPSTLFVIQIAKKDGEHWKSMGMIDSLMLDNKKVVRKAAYISATVD